MKTKFILTLLAAAPSLVFAESDYEAVVDDSVVGYWRFNDPNDYGKDASGHGSGITEMTDSAAGGPVAESTDWARGGGCLELPRTGSKSNYGYHSAVATVTSGKGFSMSRTSPGWTVATWVRGSQELVDSLKNAEWAVGDAAKFKNALKDGKWHPLVIVYRANNSSDFYRVYVDGFDSWTVTDITAGGTDSKGNPAWHIPLSVSSGAFPNDTVTLGGDIGGTVDLPILGKKTINATFFGGLDDCIIIDRELKGGNQTDKDKGEPNYTNDEVFRWVQTGETFVYSKGSSGNMFYETGSWSNNKVPQAGLAYMIENGCEVKSSKTATFAGRSLSVGRTEKLYGIKSVGGAKEVVVDNTAGKLTQVTANTTMTVDDLVLNDGTLTSSAGGQRLVANIRVRAAASNPFQISVSNGTYAVSGTMTGAGSISKIGQGTLDLSGLTESTAKVSLSEGSLRLSAVNPTLSGYTGGTLLIDFDEDSGSVATVALDSAWTGALSFMLNGTPSGFARYAVLTVPTSVKQVTAADFDNKTVSANGMTVRTKIVTDGSIQTVYVESIPSADAAGSPVLGFE